MIYPEPKQSISLMKIPVPNCAGRVGIIFSHETKSNRASKSADSEIFDQEIAFLIKTF
jgi:hypothetical protein